MRIQSTLLGILGLATSLSAHAAPCGGFVDVDDTNPAMIPFCASVEWIRNRSITFGCNTNLYCPNESVTRLQMAAFMNRLGDALIHRLVIGGQVLASVDLTTDAVICLTNSETPASYNRRGALSVSVSAASNVAGPSTFFVTPVFTSDNGTTFTSGGGAFARATSTGNSTWVNVANFSSASLDAGLTYRFGILVQSDGATTGLSDVTCTLSADLRQRDISD